MRITADTNLLVRASVRDNAEQAAAAKRLLEEATLVAIPVAIFCELAWVLKRSYRFSADHIGGVIAAYLNGETVVTDSAAVQAGLAILRLGGDFADGAMAQQGRDSGGEVFASFDRKAVRLVQQLGHSALRA